MANMVMWVWDLLFLSFRASGPRSGLRPMNMTVRTLVAKVKARISAPRHSRRIKPLLQIAVGRPCKLVRQTCKVMAHVVPAFLVTACTFMACAVMACIGTAHIVMAHIVMGCILMAYIVMAKKLWPI